MQQKNNNTKLYNYPAKKYGSYVFNETVKYQKQYGFKIGKGEHATWNNEADAFKHTYMQAQLALWFGQTAAKIAGDIHEKQGNKDMGQPKGEENMDKWNNAQGREIAKEIIRENGIWSTRTQKTNDIIAQKVMERMRSGKLITNPNDKRVYKEGTVTGKAAPVPQIYTREDIAAMSTDEYLEHEKEILNQMQTIGIPYSNKLPKSSQKSKSQTTKSTTNSENGKWVTINGNHVLLKN